MLLKAVQSKNPEESYFEVDNSGYLLSFRRFLSRLRVAFCCFSDVSCEEEGSMCSQGRFKVAFWPFLEVLELVLSFSGRFQSTHQLS
jgi:hypothetical protein